MIWPYSRGESEDEDEREGRRQEAAPPQGEAFHGGAAGGLSGAFAADRERIGGGRGDRDASGLHREKAPARSRVRPRLRGGRGGGGADAGWGAGLLRRGRRPRPADHQARAERADDDRRHASGQMEQERRNRLPRRVAPVRQYLGGGAGRGRVTQADLSTAERMAGLCREAGAGARRRRDRARVSAGERGRRERGQG